MTEYFSNSILSILLLLIIRDWNFSFTKPLVDDKSRKLNQMSIFTKSLPTYFSFIHSDFQSSNLINFQSKALMMNIQIFWNVKDQSNEAMITQDVWKRIYMKILMHEIEIPSRNSWYTMCIASVKLLEISKNVRDNVWWKASNDEEMMIEIEKNQNNRNGRADNWWSLML